MLKRNNNGEDDDAILERIKRESLKHYEEVELPRIRESQARNNQVAGPSKPTSTNEKITSNLGRNQVKISNNKHGTVSSKQSFKVQKFFNKVSSKKEIPTIQIDDDENKENTKQSEPSASGNRSDIQMEETQSSRPIWYEGSEAEGFYIAAGSTYIYPTNYPVREYQESIVRTALFKNTLVSLPTGLGKTFIAAVVMYNYYRWYPKGKIVFMAPTRPLVAQQIKACYNIMGLPIEDTTEMTGNLNVQDRVSLWKTKRVFFLTPQVMVNDIKSKSCPANLVKCVVVDEAHKAVKDYAYCHVVSLLEEAKAIYRILALSATPGNDVKGVQEIIKNLRISTLEFRGEDALDVMKYTHTKSVQSIVVNLSINIQRVKGDFLQIYDKYAKRLRECKAMNVNISTVTKFQVLKAMEKFRAHPPRGMNPTAIGSLICDFSVCMSLAHSLELLQIYGLRAFYLYLSEGGDKNKAAATRLRNDNDLSKILGRLNQMLAKKPGEEGYIWGHPKLFKLTSVLTDHFKLAKELGEKTKAIVFCQYRVVVTEVLEVLNSLNTDIKPVMFIGQSSNSKDKGMTQAKQLEIMKDFRQGLYNCMIATCVAEEGLDIGEVDLIVLMEAHKSPIRLVQRIGRTGRKRNGKCIVLVTEGREEYKFQEAMTARKSYVSSVLNAKSVRENLYQDCPAMFPKGVKPTRQLLHIEVVEQRSPKKPVVAKQVDIRSHLVNEESPFISNEDYKNLVKKLGKSNVNFNKIPLTSFLFNRINEGRMSVDELLDNKFTKFSEFNDWNLQLQNAHEVSHSLEAEMMCGLLNRYYSFDVKFFNTDSKKRKRDNEIVSDDEELITKKGKKKKETKNFGMDIRSCMAAVKDKGKNVKEYDENEIIDVDAINESKFENSKLIDELIKSLDKELSLKNLKSEQTPVVFQNTLLPSLEQYSLISKNNKASFPYVITQYKNLKNKSDLILDIISELKEIKIENEGNINATKILNAVVYWRDDHSQKSESSLVGIDDLFKESNEAEKNTVKNGKDELWEPIPDDFFKLKSSSTPNNKYLTASTPKNKILINKSNSTQFNNSQKNVMSPLARHFDSPIPQFDSPIPKLSSPIDKNLDSPTPKNLATTKSKRMDAVWNIDDLFQDDDVQECQSPKYDNDTCGTMLGITQMVSLIERDKLNQEEIQYNNVDLDRKTNVQDKIAKTDNSLIQPEDKTLARINIDNNKIATKSNFDDLLDEDDDLFTSICDLEPTTPTKTLLAPKMCPNQNNSIDMFASTIHQSKFMDETPHKLILNKSNEDIIINCQADLENNDKRIVENDVKEKQENFDETISDDDIDNDYRFHVAHFENADEIESDEDFKNFETPKVNLNNFAELDDLFDDNSNDKHIPLTQKHLTKLKPTNSKTIENASLKNFAEIDDIFEEAEIVKNKDAILIDNDSEDKLISSKFINNNIVEIDDLFDEKDDELTQKRDSPKALKQKSKFTEYELNFSKQSKIVEIDDLFDEEGNDTAGKRKNTEQKSSGDHDNIADIDDLFNEVENDFELLTQKNNQTEQNRMSACNKISESRSKDNKVQENSIFEKESQVKNVSNFKRFNKKKTTHSQISFFSQTLASSSKIDTIKVKTPERCKPSSSQDKDINSENWWFDYDFPNYPKRSTPPKKSIEHLNRERSKVEPSSSKPNSYISQIKTVKKLTDFPGVTVKVKKSISDFWKDNKTEPDQDKIKNLLGEVKGSKENDIVDLDSLEMSFNVANEQSLLGITSTKVSSVNFIDKNKDSKIINNVNKEKDNNVEISTSRNSEKIDINETNKYNMDKDKRKILLDEEDANSSFEVFKPVKKVDRFEKYKAGNTWGRHVDCSSKETLNLIKEDMKDSEQKFFSRANDEKSKEFHTLIDRGKNYQIQKAILCDNAERSVDKVQKVTKEKVASSSKLSLVYSDDEGVFRNDTSSSKSISSTDRKKKRRKVCGFIEQEAEVSEDGETSSGNDDSTDLDQMDQSFIDDKTDHSDHSVNIHAKYLQSVKSPIIGKFKIPQKVNNRLNVYSQYECNDTTYLEDSFCVGSDEGSEENELSEIEIAERKLEKKRKFKKQQNNIKSKRRRIKIISPDSNKSDQTPESIKPKSKKFRILSDSETSDNSPLITNYKKKFTNTLKNKNISSKKSLNFAEKGPIIESDDELEKAIRESQIEFERVKEREDEDLELAIRLSKEINQPSTSGLGSEVI